MKEQTDHRVRSVVNRRYQRDLVLGFIAILGIIVGAVLAVIFLKPYFQRIDNMQPEEAFILIIFITCLALFLKYARK